MLPVQTHEVAEAAPVAVFVVVFLFCARTGGRARAGQCEVAVRLWGRSEGPVPVFCHDRAGEAGGRARELRVVVVVVDVVVAVALLLF